MLNQLKNQIFLTSLMLGFSLFSGYGQDNKTTSLQFETDRTNAYAIQLENYLRDYLVDQYEERSAQAWHRDYSSIDAFKRSVEPNRQKWESVVIKPPLLSKTGELIKKTYTIEGVQGEWVELPLGSVTAQAFLAFPPGIEKMKKAPLVIVQHGISSTPETLFREGNCNSYAKKLLEAGFAVLAPVNLTSIKHRNRIESLCRLANISLPGIELARVQNLLDVVLADPRIDPEKVGMWGISLGGLATMFWMPLEPRIKAGVVSAWFNQRRNKMAVPDSRYVSFLGTTEEYVFATGWLTEFTDHDLVSLICPRPLLIQHGKKDRIAYWPQVLEEFNIAKKHYVKLHIDDRIQIEIQEGEHEAIVESGVQFMTRWLAAETGEN